MAITILSAEPDDCVAIANVYAQPNAVSGTLQIPYPTPQLRRKRLEGNPESMRSLVACVDDQIVGSIVVWHETHSPRRRHAGGIGMGVHDDWHGQGVGTALLDAASPTTG